MLSTPPPPPPGLIYAFVLECYMYVSLEPSPFDYWRGHHPNKQQSTDNVQMCAVFCRLFRQPIYQLDAVTKLVDYLTR